MDANASLCATSRELAKRQFVVHNSSSQKSEDRYESEVINAKYPVQDVAGEYSIQYSRLNYSTCAIDRRTRKWPTKRRNV